MLPKNNMINVISKSRFELDFDDTVFDYYCFKITDKYLYFYASSEEGEIVPISEIEKRIKNKLEFNIVISILDSTGVILNFIFLESIKMLKIKKIIDFDYNSNDILSIKVRYVYKNKKIFKNHNEVQKYKRKIKISKIDESI